MLKPSPHKVFRRGVQTERTAFPQGDALRTLGSVVFSANLDFEDYLGPHPGV